MLLLMHSVALFTFLRFSSLTVFAASSSASELASTSTTSITPPLPPPPPPISLSPENFDEITANKTAFILFYAPYCAHSQIVLPAWNQMRIEWQNNDVSAPQQQGLVAQVDCTVDKATQRWCDKQFKILGFPTLLYGDPSLGGIFLTEYGGDKDYRALSTFANATLSKPICSPANLRHCDRDTQRKIQWYLQLSEQEMEGERQKVERQLDGIERNFRREFKRMQAVYDSHSNKFELERASIKDNLKLLHAVKASR